MAKRGIDISSHQGNIDLAALKNQIDFVIIRAGYGTKGTLDTKFKRNADLCIELGIPFGFYWYSYALDEAGAEREADTVINALAPYKDKYSYGVWFDMEDADHYKSKNGMPSNQTLRNMCKVFCQKVEDAGYYTGIYASSSWFNNQLNGPDLDDFDKWVAQWPTSGGKQRALDVSADERTDKTLWQFTSDGQFSGYNGRLDTNYAYIDYPAIIRGAAPSIEVPEVPKKSVQEVAEEVKAGLWGNGAERKQRLEAAGYNYNEVQDLVNASYDNSNVQKPTYTVYSVQSGDTLSGIGAKLGADWKQIAEINGIKGPKYIIYPGQKLKVPTADAKPVPVPQVPTYRTYTVRPGDSLSAIGAKYGVRWQDIATLNGVKGPKYIIYAGQVLKIPN